MKERRVHEGLPETPWPDPLRRRVSRSVEGGDPFCFEALKDCRDVVIVQMTRPEEIGSARPFGYLAWRMQYAREGLHNDEVTYACVNCTPSRARLSMFGVVMSSHP